MPRLKKTSTPFAYSGFILTFEPQRTPWLADQLYLKKEIREPFSALDWTFLRRELVALVLSHNPLSIFAFALMERMHGSGGSGKLKMRMYNLVIFDEPVKISEISIKSTDTLISTPERLNRLDPITWDLFIDELKRLRPYDAGAIDERISLREADIRLLDDSPKVDRLNEQRDAVGLSLDIAQIGHAPVMRSVQSERVDTANSILDLLDDITVQERSLLEHDTRIFELLLDTRPDRSAYFHGDAGRNVRIHIVDKDALETVLGIDLIIYSVCHDNWLLLQYKRMKKDDDSWKYKVDKQLNFQLDCMAKFRTAAAAEPVGSRTLWTYRLNEEPFYFKFCEGIRLSARDDSLVRGITLCETHLREFLELPESVGPQTGKSIGYHNCPRYLNNSDFIQLARDGWIGAGRQATSLMKKVLQANREGGRSAMLAVIDTPQATSASGRGRKR